MEGNGTKGLSQRELILEIRQDLKEHIVRHDAVHHELDDELHNRPTRIEVFQLAAGAGALAGLVFGLIQALS